MQVFNPSYTFTRPNDSTAYASGDLVANSTTAGSVVPMSFATGTYPIAAPGRLTRVRLSHSSTSVTNTQFRVHLYTSTMTCANGDNAAWSTSNVAGYIAFIDVTIDKAFTDGAAGFGSLAAGAELFYRLPTPNTIYALLEARAAYAPTAQETFTLTLEIVDAY